MPALTKYWSDFISLIYPHTCEGCNTDNLGNDKLLCWKCTNELPLTHFEKHRNNLTEDLFTGRIPLQMASSFLFFGKESLAQHLIYQVKYKGNKELGVVLGQMMGQALKNAGWQGDIDLIVPLPLNKKKETTRGFNQAELLARGIGEILEKPVEPVAVVRTKFTQTQTRKSREQRWENVAEVFDLTESHNLDNKHVLLVDDVVTTGATLEACGQILLKTPGLKLSIATLAFASKI